jgi:hypothetical protein
LRKIKQLYTIEKDSKSHYIRIHSKKSRMWTIRKLYEILDLMTEINPKMNCLIIDKRTEKLDSKVLERLKNDLEKNKYPGDIVWPASESKPNNSSEIKQLVNKVENLLIENNLHKRRFPSDYMHALFCLSINKSGNNLDKIHKLDSNWTVLKTFEIYSEEAK